MPFASIGNHKAECLSLDHDVQEKILGLKREFTDISCRARQWLESHYPKAKGAAWWLNETLRGRKDEPLVIEGSVSDYGELGDQLQKKWSFTNPDFLEQLIGETDITLIQQMSEYRKSLIASVVPSQSVIKQLTKKCALKITILTSHVLF